MSDTEALADPNTEAEQGKETDWKAEARKWESRAKDNLNAARANEDAAKRLAEIEQANKTEAEKAAERLAAAEKRAAALEAKAARAEVAAAKGVPVELLTGSTQEELEASADALIKFKGESGKKLLVPNEGKSPKSGRTGSSSWSEVLSAMDARRG